MIKKVGVIGCGLMGSGIAQVSAQAGFQTIVSRRTRSSSTEDSAASRGASTALVASAKLDDERPRTTRSAA